MAHAEFCAVAEWRGLRAAGLLDGKWESDLEAIWNYGCELFLGRKLATD